MGFLPDRGQLTIGFAHVAYQLADEFRSRGAPFAHFEATSLEELQARVDEADVLVLSGLWRNEFLDRAPKLRFVQSASAGTDQYDRARFTARGVRLASAQGANERAVAEHAMALILALSRLIHFARDDQMNAHWRGMLADRSRREQELGGQTLVIVGLGRIGVRLAGLAHAFGMRVIGVKRQPTEVPGVERVVSTERLLEVLPQADVVALTCPLTPETEGLIGAAQLGAMKPTAALINVARGRVVDEGALVAALQAGRIASAGLDCFHEEPLPASSPFWSMPNVIVTSHTAGETRRYETNVVDLLMENLDRLYRGEALKNGIV
ncbi:MAG: D-2-hydroxyacid dehydrogenase [Pseudomonadota bacterium]|nr:D-2-hydroxyacid dehydrogenase [Pseudomonadota bacterium]